MWDHPYLFDQQQRSNFNPLNRIDIMNQITL